MKRNEHFIQGPWPTYLILVLLAAVSLWAAYKLLREEDAAAQPRVSVIVEDSSNERWTAFRLGLDQAAREYGIDVTFTASTVFHGVEEQKALISQEIAGGTDALILSPFDSEQADLADGVRGAVYVETDGLRDSGPGTAAVTADGKAMGQALGSMLAEDGGTGISVAVLTRNLQQYAGKEALQGLTEAVEEAGGSVLMLDAGGADLPEVLDLARGQDLIAVLDDPLLVQAAAQADTAENGSGRLYGIGCSPSAISFLDRGVIAGMVVPNEFTMGYQSLAQLAMYLHSELPEMKDLEIGFARVRTGEVHDPVNEKLLFPLAQ